MSYDASTIPELEEEELKKHVVDAIEYQNLASRKSQTQKNSNATKLSLDDDNDAQDELKPKRGRPKRTKQEAGFSKAFIQREYERMRQDFEQQKAETLAKIPQQYIEWFRKIGFARWGRAYHPVLFLGPYDIGPCEARDLWRAMFDKTGEVGQRHSMSRLVYWYGSVFGLQFSLVAQNSCVLYEQGVKKGFDKPWISLKKKILNGKKLSQEDEETIRKWQEMEKDIGKSPEDRVVRDQQKEDHDALLDGDLDLVAMYGDPAEVDNIEESGDEELRDDDVNVEKTLPKKRKPGLPKKKKDNDKEINDTRSRRRTTASGLEKKKETNGAEDTNIGPPKKRKRGSPKKTKDDEDYRKDHNVYCGKVTVGGCDEGNCQDYNKSKPQNEHTAGIIAPATKNDKIVVEPTASRIPTLEYLSTDSDSDHSYSRNANLIWI